MSRAAHRYSKQLKEWCLAAIRDGKPALLLFDQNKQNRAHFGPEADGRSFLVLNDPGLKKRAVMAVADSGLPVLGLLSNDGKLLWKAPKQATQPTCAAPLHNAVASFPACRLSQERADLNPRRDA